MWWLEVPEFYVDHNRTSKIMIFCLGWHKRKSEIDRENLGIGSDLHNQKTWCCKQSEWWWCFDLGHERKTGIVSGKSVESQSLIDQKRGFDPKKRLWIRLKLDTLLVDGAVKKRTAENTGDGYKLDSWPSLKDPRKKIRVIICQLWCKIRPFVESNYV